MNRENRPDLLIPGSHEEGTRGAQRPPPAPMPSGPPPRQDPYKDPFHVYRYNRDLSTWIEAKDVDYTLARFTAPKYGAAVIQGIAFYPNQIEALIDLTITVKVVGAAAAYLSPRYGRIGWTDKPERVTIRLEPSQSLEVVAQLTQDYRPLGAVDFRIWTTCELWGYYESGGTR